MKRLFCLVLCAVLLSALVIPVRADDDNYNELRERIITAMHNGDRLDISAYGLQRDEIEEIYVDLLNRGLLPWYAAHVFDWTSAPDGTIAIISLRDQRIRGFSEDDYERAIAELIAETCYDGMTDLQKILSVHDYIVSRVEYRYYDSTNNGYHALVREETQCYGYSQAFLRIMDRLGIPCKIVICDDVGDGVGHAWNIVQIDGEWYHLDLTWDDPIPDAPGRALHTYFLKTDMEFKWKYGHEFGWETETDCKDKTYSDDNLWDDLRSPMIFLDADTVLLRRDDDTSTYICLLDLKTEKETLLYSTYRPSVSFNGRLYDIFSASLCWWNDRVWFNTADSIFSMTLDGSDLRTEYTYDVAENGKFIYGCQVNDGMINLVLSDLEYNVVDRQVKLENVQYHEHDYKTSYVSATCVSGGYTLKSCACGISYQIDRSDPKGHELTEETAKGITRQLCMNCDYLHEEQIPTTDPAPTQPAEVPQVSSLVNLRIPAIAIVTAALIISTVFLIRRKKKKNTA